MPTRQLIATTAGPGVAGLPGTWRALALGASAPPDATEAEIAFEKPNDSPGTAFAWDAFSFAPSGGANLLADPEADFEGGLAAGWEPFQSSLSRQNSDAWTGSWSMREATTLSGVGSAGASLERFLPVVGGASYDFSARCKQTTGDERTARLLVRWYKVTGQGGWQLGMLPIGRGGPPQLVTTVSGGFSPAAGVWEDRPRPNTSSVAVTARYARLAVMYSPSAWPGDDDVFYLDDAFFGPVGGTNLLTADESGFEGGVPPEWSATSGAVSRTSAEAHSGSWSLRVDRSGAATPVLSLNRYIPVDVPGTAYQFNAWHKSHPGGLSGPEPIELWIYLYS